MLLHSCMTVFHQCWTGREKAFTLSLWRIVETLGLWLGASSDKQTQSKIIVEGNYLNFVSDIHKVDNFPSRYNKPSLKQNLQILHNIISQLMWHTNNVVQNCKERRQYWSFKYLAPIWIVWMALLAPLGEYFAPPPSAMYVYMHFFFLHTCRITGRSSEFWLFIFKPIS